MKKISLLLVTALLVVLVSTQGDIYSKYYSDAKNIADGMSVEQLAGQMIAADFEAITDMDKETTYPDQAVSLGLGSLLISGLATPTSNGNIAKLSWSSYQDHLNSFKSGTLENWKKLIDRFKDLGVSVTAKDGGRYKIKFLMATDAIHGDQHTLGTVIFPHNIGTSCSHNEDNFFNVGFWTK